jgi:hypothetical protein
MSETARAMLELAAFGRGQIDIRMAHVFATMLILVAKGWGALALSERAVFRDWVGSAFGEDVFALLCYAHHTWVRAPATLALPKRGWSDLRRHEQQVFNDWCLHAHGEDLFLLLRHANRKWIRGASSTSQTLQAITDTEAPPSIPPPKKENDQ